MSSVSFFLWGAKPASGARRTPMRTMLLALFVVAWAGPSQAAQRTKPTTLDDMATRAQMCRAMVGREVPEATDGHSHEGQLNVQRFSDCLTGKLPGIGR